MSVDRISIVNEYDASKSIQIREVFEVAELRGNGASELIREEEAERAAMSQREYTNDCEEINRRKTIRYNKQYQDFGRTNR